MLLVVCPLGGCQDNCGRHAGALGKAKRRLGLPKFQNRFPPEMAAILISLFIS